MNKKRVAVILFLLALTLLFSAGCAKRDIESVDRAKAGEVDARAGATREAVRHEEVKNKQDEDVGAAMVPVEKEARETERLWILAGTCLVILAAAVCAVFLMGGGSFHGIRFAGAKADKARMEARFSVQPVRSPLDVVQIKTSTGVVAATAVNILLHGGIEVNDKTNQVQPIRPIRTGQVPEIARIAGMSAAALLAAQNDGQFVISVGDFSRPHSDDDQPLLPQTRRGKLLEGGEP